MSAENEKLLAKFRDEVGALCQELLETYSAFYEDLIDQGVDLNELASSCLEVRYQVAKDFSYALETHINRIEAALRKEK